MRVFDPVRVGRSECRAWSAYYRRDWLGVAVGAVQLVWFGFGMGPVRTVLGAWYVLRANQAWAPFPDNDPAAARRQMSRFYALVDAAGRADLDPVTAADLEVHWWHVHRQHQHDPRVSQDRLTAALTALYAYVYDTAETDVRPAAELRVQAMELSDAWVAAGCRLDDPTLAREREALVASYTALPPVVVHRFR